MKTNNCAQIVNKRIFIFLAIVFGVYYSFWLVSVLLPLEQGKTIISILQFPLVFMGTPALAVFLTRKLTVDHSPLKFSTRVRKNRKALLFSSLAPTVSIFLGFVVFYFVFPNDLDFTGAYISRSFGAYGAPADIQLTVRSMLVMGLIICAISAIAVPIWFIALGEDIGWQGYLLPLLCQKLPVRAAVLITGALWGLGHAPLIYFGFNYGMEYAGAPFTGIAMMVFVCIVLGTWTSYVTLKYENCMYAAVIHGAVDVIGETGIWVSLGTKSTLLGPNPTGIIGVSVLLIGALILLARMPNITKKTEENCNG